MKAKISFDVGCFDRYLEILVKEADKENTKHIMNFAYDAWCTDPEIVTSDWCCEEYILHCLQEKGIEFDVVEREEII